MLTRIAPILLAALFAWTAASAASFAEDPSNAESDQAEEAAPPRAPPSSPAVMFPALSGRWTGEGRLGIKDNPPETVKCRATYIAGATAAELKQTIRCATAGGSIEVISNLVNAGGKLSGKWQETMHNIGGDLEGAFTPAGLRIVVKGADLAANMDVIVKDNKQLVEIQFFNSTLIGLSMLMTKG